MRGRDSRETIWLWSVMARKSSPCSRARRPSSAAVKTPSEPTVWVCRSPLRRRSLFKVKVIS